MFIFNECRIVSGTKNVKANGQGKAELHDTTENCGASISDSRKLVLSIGKSVGQ